MTVQLTCSLGTSVNAMADTFLSLSRPAWTSTISCRLVLDWVTSFVSDSFDTLNGRLLLVVVKIIVVFLHESFPAYMEDLQDNVLRLLGCGLRWVK
jgi:hypothetical protein